MIKKVIFILFILTRAINLYCQDNKKVFDDYSSYSFHGFSEFDHKTITFFYSSLDSLESMLNEADTLLIWIDYDQNMLFRGNWDSLYLENTQFHQFKPYDDFIKRLIELSREHSNIFLLGNKITRSLDQLTFLGTLYPDLIDFEIIDMVSDYMSCNEVRKSYYTDEILSIITDVDASNFNWWEKYYLQAFFGKIIFGEWYTPPNGVSFVAEKCDKKAFFISNQTNVSDCLWLSKLPISAIRVYLYSSSVQGVKGRRKVNKYFISSYKNGYNYIQSGSFGLFNALKSKFELQTISPNAFIYVL